MEYQHSWGMSAALTAAALWAVATFLYRSAGARISPIRLNLFKGLLASFVLGIIFAWQGNLLPDHPATVYWYLLISGVIGIGIGDTAFFASLNRLGARQSVLIFEAAAPLFTLALAVPIIGEKVPGSALAGTLAVLVGVVVAMSSRKRGRDDEPLSFRGVFYSVFAALCQAAGAILSKLAFQVVEVSAVWSSLVRIFGAVLFLAPLAWYAGGKRQEFDVKLIRIVLTATTLGTIMGVSLLQVAFKFTYAATAQALAGTVSLFVLAIGIGMGHRVSAQAWIGTIVAVAGVFWLFLGDAIWERMAG